ncbi:WhiB family transcriptional regulator [Micromonospora sp. HM5-17]|jgi:Transcription factor WhiB.|uniref:WhiB family transcriptional regulator n=1 Tax=Micromonospora sp. HM5-17 TaxID=2487710 RepID=UPI000F46B3AE|nr:WhiB family transcriptional regulator [Micromonospora sp. HM5-17]ROT29683.1 WhiB family transcriptional regulator [Micromonospora sp. HM5-17]
MTDWRHRAACRDTDPELFFPISDTSSVADAAIRICRTACPVRQECLTWALNNGEQHGVWGGLTEGQRRRAQLHRLTPAEAIALSPAPATRGAQQ